MFEPKGPLPEWKLIYNLIVEAELGTMISYSLLDAALGRPLGTTRGPLYKAIRELEVQHQRTLSVVTGKGYRVVGGADHERLARYHHRKSRRQLTKSMAKLTSVDRTLLTDEQRRRIDAMALLVSRQQDQLRRLDTRTERLERALHETRQAHAKTRAKTDQLEDRMTRVEALVRERFPERVLYGGQGRLGTRAVG